MSHCYAIVGINEAKFDDGHFLPHTQGFQYVGTIIPFTLAWQCDTSQKHIAGNYELSLLEAGTSLEHIGILSYFVSFKSNVRLICCGCCCIATHASCIPSGLFLVPQCDNR